MVSEPFLLCAKDLQGSGLALRSLPLETFSGRPKRRERCTWCTGPNRRAHIVTMGRLHYVPFMIKFPFYHLHPLPDRDPKGRRRKIRKACSVKKQHTPLPPTGHETSYKPSYRPEMGELRSLLGTESGKLDDILFYGT